MAHTSMCLGLTSRYEYEYVITFFKTFTYVHYTTLLYQQVFTYYANTNR